MRLNLLSTTLLALGCAFVLGCPDAGKDDTATDTDADTDADADTDSDTDADTDTDVTHITPTVTGGVDDLDIAADYAYEIHYETTFSAPSTGEGTLTYLYTYDGATVCDFEESVVTTPYEGDCEGCTFAMTPAVTVTTDNSTADCVPSATYSFQGDDVVKGLYLKFFETYEGTYYNYYDVFQAGFNIDYTSSGGGYYEGYTTTFHYEGSYYSTVTYGDDAFAWDFSSSGSDQDFGAYLYYCSAYYAYQTYGVYPGSADTGSLDCFGEFIDTWTFEGVDGGTAYVTVDTVADATAFDPQMWVNDPDGCLLGYADDSFACTFPPPTYECPGVIIEDLTAGTYTVVVNSYGDCAGETSDYSLAVDITTPI